MPRPARDLNPRVYLHGGLQSLRVVWLGAQDLTGPTSTISWEYRFREWTNPRIVNPVIEFIMGWSIPGNERAQVREGPRMGSRRITNPIACLSDDHRKLDLSF